jgi:hypothetical protein
VQNLAHSASLHSREKSAPSKPGIKQVGPWHDLYTLIGTASATLIGLLFVAASVGASYYNRERYPAFRAFVSPSVVHFTTVLAACLIGIAPVRSWTPFGLLIGGDGLFGIVYAVFVWRSMVLQGFNRTLDLNDRVWYEALPVLGYGCWSPPASFCCWEWISAARCLRSGWGCCC